MSVILYPSIFCVALLMDLFVLYVLCLTISLNCLVKQCAILLVVVVILLLNVMKVLSVGGCPLLDRPCMVFQIICVLLLGSSVHLDVHSIGFVCVCVCI